jgi:coatomer subunit beta'
LQDGYPDAFEVLGEIEETVKTGDWVGDCFIFTNALNQLNYYVVDEIVTVAHLEKPLYLLGYLPDVNRVFLADLELNVISYNVELSILQYQVLDSDNPTFNLNSDRRYASRLRFHFFEKQGFKKQALAVTTDPEHQFDLAPSSKTAF